MTTITEILTEAFNRVKAEHGVTLRGVDFTGADIEFSVTSKTALSSPYGAQRPEGATHTYNGWYLRQAPNGAWEWFFAGHWELPPKNVEADARRFTPL